mgnify:CR=1 FL=1
MAPLESDLPTAFNITYDPAIREYQIGIQSDSTEELPYGPYPIEVYETDTFSGLI